MVIVGAGIAGLATGCYARMNGYDTTIFEMHDKPGGLCTAWKRKGYKFDVSMHMLTGSKGGPVHKMWEELDVMQDQEFFYHDALGRIESGDKALVFSTDARRLEEQMVALSPADAELSREFARLLGGRDMMNGASLKPPEMTGLLDKLKMIVAFLPMMGTFRKYGNTTLQEFASRFQDPFLRDAVRFSIDSPGWRMIDFPMAAMMGFLKSAVEEAGVPLGGSQKVVFKIAKLFKRLDGEIVYKSRVADIIVEDDRALGVRLEDGTERRADVVVWAGDGHTAVFDILGGRYVGDEIRNIYEEWIPVRPMVQVMIGVARDMRKEPYRLVLRLDEPITIADQEYDWLAVVHRSFDPSMAPAGKASVMTRPVAVRLPLLVTVRV